MKTEIFHGKAGILASSLLALSMMLCQPTAEAANRYAFATAGQGGTYHILGAAIADLINKNSDNIQLTATATSGTAANVPLIHSGQMKMGFGNSPSDKAAADGSPPFKKPFDNLRVMMIGYTNPGAFIARADSDIKTIEDFRGKRISMPVGAPATKVMQTLLSAYGMEAGKDYTAIPINFGQAVEALQDRRIDVSLQWAAPPSPAVLQMAELFPIRIIPIDNEKALAAVKEKLGVIPYTFKAQVYKGIDEPVASIAMQQSFLVNKDVPNEDVQEFIRLVTENTATLAKSHSVGAELTLENAARALDYELPPHPGAVEYFKEKGFSK
ncbi:MAG: TAXI family TRAP transporter solute-binding subunit [Burkholderiaceae bacterium]|nr:TAXI family TRAP transporter solute-binding subunit [Burkholderiaceae bacterium]